MKAKQNIAKEKIILSEIEAEDRHKNDQVEGTGFCISKSAYAAN